MESEKKEEERKEQQEESRKKKEKADRYIYEDYTKEEFDNLSWESGTMQPPADYGFEYIEHRPWDGGSLENVKDIKYIVDDINQANFDATVLKTAPLKAGDLYAMSIRDTSPKVGFVKGYYIFNIPNNAKAIHPSGDMRYGWEDDRILDYVEMWVNKIRSNYATVPKHKDMGLSTVRRVTSSKNENIENRWNGHRKMMSN